MSAKGNSLQSSKASKSGSNSNAGGSSSKRSSKVGGGKLFQAVIARDLVAAKAAIKEGNNVNEIDEGGWTALRKAARNGDLPIVQLLLEHGADISSNEQAAIITASSWGRADVLRELLESKGDVGPTSEWEMGPLRAAAQHGHLKCIKILIEFDAEINLQDRQNCDAISTAWEHNRSEIVLHLVENGANLNSAEDWSMLADSPATAMMVTQGISRRNERRLRLDEERGTVTAQTYSSGVVVPMVAFCKMIEFVPHAAAVLFDKVLLKYPKDGPIRADLKGSPQRTAYLSVNRWIPKEEPRLLDLAPRDQGNGTAISLRVFHHLNFVNLDVVFHLTRSNSELYTCQSVQALLLHVWESFVCSRFYMDMCLEVLCLVFLGFWSGTSSTLQKGSTIFTVAATASVILIFFRFMDEFGDEMRQLQFFDRNNRLRHYCKGLLNNTGLSVGRCLRLLFGLLCIVLACWQQFWDTEFVKTSYYWDWYKPALTFYVILRWGHLLTFLRCCPSTGPVIIPILNCYRYIGPFVVTSLIIILATVHCISNFGHLRFIPATDRIEAKWTTRYFIDNMIMIYKTGFFKRFDIDNDIATSMYVDPQDQDYLQCGNEWFGKGCYRNSDDHFMPIDSGTFNDVTVALKNFVLKGEQMEIPERFGQHTRYFYDPEVSYLESFVRLPCKAGFLDYKLKPSADSKTTNPGDKLEKWIAKDGLRPERWFDSPAGSIKPSALKKMTPCVNQPFRDMETLWFIFYSLAFSVFLSNVFIAILGEAFDFEQEKAVVQFNNERCHLCFRYMLAISDASNPIFSLMEKFMTKVLKIFSDIPENGYLWTAIVIDEDTNNEDGVSKMATGRLGHLKHSADQNFHKVVTRSLDIIEDAELRVGKNFDISYNDLKLFRREVMGLLKTVRTDGRDVAADDSETGVVLGDSSTKKGGSSVQDSITRENLKKLDEAGKDGANNKSKDEDSEITA